MNRHAIQRTTPARGFNDAFLLGNGHLGATMHGRPGVEKIGLNLDTFWSGGPASSAISHDPARPGTLTSLRHAIREKRFTDADRLAERLQSGSWTQSYQPVGTLHVHHGPIDDAEDYRRELDMRNAEASHRYRSHGLPGSMSSFVSAVDDVLVVEAQNTTDLRVEFDSPHPFHDPMPSARPDDRVQVWVGRAPSVALPIYVDDPSPIQYADAQPGPDGTVSAGMGFAVAVLVQPQISGARLLVAAVDGFRGRHERPSADLPMLADQAQQIILRAAGLSTGKLRERHRADQHSLFDRTTLTLRNGTYQAEADDVERGFDLGRYLLIASSRRGTQPANLQGIWNEDVRPGWSCNYTTNINLQMNYWAAYPSGLGELAEPLESFVADLAANPAAAREFYGARGWTVHHNTDVWGFSAPVRGEPQWANWPSAGAWLVAHLIDRDAFRAEGRFTDEVLRPAVEGSAKFALDMLVERSDGRLSPSPSTSPEHRFEDRGTLAATSAGTTMDLALYRPLLEKAAQLTRDPALRAEVATALHGIAVPTVGDDGTLLEWADDRLPEDRGHRHLSHLYGVYPGDSIDEVTTPALFHAAVAALRDRLAHGSGHTGWSQSWILNLAARLRDASLVEQSLRILLRDLTSESLLDLHPVDDHPSGYRFQIDGNFGLTAGIVESLVQSHGGVLRVFNAVPAAWEHGRITGIHARGGAVIDVEWTTATLDLTIRDAARRTIIVCLPDLPDLRVRGADVTAAAPAPEGRCRLMVRALSETVRITVARA
ncbi:MAG: glycoside hydrolase family 95 protein [Rhodococcus sp. (in: high G+C Gram-positive bacteria)]